MRCAPPSPSASRIFGEEISPNNVLDVATTSNDQNRTSIESKPDTASSDCGTDSSSVAHLRGILNDFGKKNQQHYVKNVATPSKEELEKPIRPKVRPNLSVPNGPTPLPPAAANALVKRIMAPEQPRNNAASASTVFRARPTPVRICIKAAPVENVQATNEGYASVAKLSKWLADDPTSTKKVKQLRRGANIIAKSRKFDKVLANMVVEEFIPRDCVSRRKTLLQKAMSDDISEDESSTVRSAKSTDKKDWMKLGETSDVTSVSEKKKWLSSAFQSSTVSVTKPVAGKARTEVLSSSDNDFGNLAKEKWRKRSPAKALAAVANPRGGSVIVAADSLRSGAPMEVKNPEATLAMSLQRKVDLSDGPKESIPACKNDGAPEVRAFNAAAKNSKIEDLMVDERKSSDSSNSCSASNKVCIEATSSLSIEKIPASSLHGEQNCTAEEGTSTPVDFRGARELLVQRSKANGNDVEVFSAVKRRTAKFETLEKESRRKSTALGMLKPGWEGTKEGYIKTFRQDIVPKKGFGELP